MPCYFPMKAYPSLAVNPETGKHGRTFSGTKSLIEGALYTLPCGVCFGCRVDRAEGWAVRATHEAKMCNEAGSGSAFLTLTFDNEHLPPDNSVSVDTFQRFMKRLRYEVGKSISLRYLGCGEYGSRLGRSHYHALIFGYGFPDKRLYKTVGKNTRLYTSELLSKVWPYGFCTVGNVSYQSARYVSSYVMKKLGGDRAEAHYQRSNPETGEVWAVEREFQLMSLKPGLGKSWLDKYKSDVYPADAVLIDNKLRKPPRYYDQQLSEEEFEPIRRARAKRARLRPEEHSKERLWTRHECAELRVERLEREKFING